MSGSWGSPGRPRRWPPAPSVWGSELHLRALHSAPKRNEAGGEAGLAQRKEGNLVPQGYLVGNGIIAFARCQIAFGAGSRWRARTIAWRSPPVGGDRPQRAKLPLLLLRFPLAAPPGAVSLHPLGMLPPVLWVGPAFLSRFGPLCAHPATIFGVLPLLLLACGYLCDNPAAALRVLPLFPGPFGPRR